MENASKALIIAGAILITIVVVSLGVVLFNRMSDSARAQGDMTAQQISAFNSKLTPYFGNNISGSQVNALIDRVTAINQTVAKSGDESQIVTVYNGKKIFVSYDKSNKKPSYGTVRKAKSGEFYVVTAEADQNGLFTTIRVTPETK